MVWFVVCYLLFKSVNNIVQHKMQGELGQGTASVGHPSAENAIKDFEKKFKDKTKNNWADRDNFVAQKGKYTLIEVDGDAEAEVKVTTVPLLCPPSPIH